MNASYQEINCADAAKIIGVDYSTVAGWCRNNIVNAINVSDGTKNGRYVLSEDEVQYLKRLKEKFGKYFIREYRKDWKIGSMPANKADTHEATIKSVIVNTTIEKPIQKRLDIDEVAIKIGYIQDIKDKLEKLEEEKQKLMNEYESLKKEVIEAL